MQIYRGVVPFILLQLTGLAIVGFFPYLVNYLPNRVQLTSETAPPPINPLLQACMERYVFDQYALDTDALRASIERARALDVSYLPEANRTALAEGFEAALATFGLVDAVRQANIELDDDLAAYRALHREVRALQRGMREIAEIIEQQEEILDRLRRSGAALEGDEARLEQDIERLSSERRAIEVLIPDRWEASRERYLARAETAKKARLRYRRNVDVAYGPVKEMRLVIAQAEALAALAGQVLGLAGVIADEPAAQAMETIKAAEKALRTIAGTSPITAKLSKARRALKGAEPDRETANGLWLEALALFEVENAWRRRAATELAAGLDAYDEAIKSNIGLRQQDRLTSDQAAFIAACRSTHVDISLSF